LIVYRVTSLPGGSWGVRFFPTAHEAKAFAKALGVESKTHKLTLEPWSRDKLCGLLEQADVHPMSLSDVPGVVCVEEA
jgi:hypothetical protein